MQFSKMQYEIYGSLVTIQYTTKCTNPLYPKFTSNKFSTYIFCCNLYLVIAYVLILTSDKCLHPSISHCPLIMGILQQKCNDMAYPSQYGNKLAEKHWQQLQNKVPYFWGRASSDFGASHYGIQTVKMGFNHFLTFMTFQHRGLHHLDLYGT